MKSLLKQVSLVMLCMAVSVGPMTRLAQATDFTNAKEAVDATKFFKGSKNISVWMGVWAEKDKVAYKKIKKEIDKKTSSIKNQTSQVREQATQYKNELTNNFRGNASMFSGNTITAIKSQIGEDIKTKAKDIATGKELTRLLNEEVIDAMNQQAKKTSKTGPGVPTEDFANITTGMFNLDSVYQSYHANEGVRDEDTRACAAMGVSGMKKGSSSGLECCKKWAVLQNSKSPNTKEYNEKKESIDRNNVGVSTTLDSVEGKSVDKLIEMCCSLSPDMCKTKAQEKAECLDGQMKNGASKGDAWKTCDIECNKKYGELVYNEDQKYDEDRIDELVKEMNECYKDEWSPSTTVLTASELAPVVPSTLEETVQEYVKKEK